MNLAKVTEIYTNSTSLIVDVFNISNLRVETFLKATSAVFRAVDRDDELQLEASRRVWRLRATVLYTLREFANGELKLLEQAYELIEQTAPFPHLQAYVRAVCDATNELIKIQENPKRVLLDKVVHEIDGHGLLLTRMSNGGALGWPNRDENSICISGKEIWTFRSSLELNSPVPYIVIPGGIKTIPTDLVQKIFFSGITSRIVVCMYQSEGFKQPSRLDMSTCNILNPSSRIELRFSMDEATPSDLDVTDDMDDWAADQFWVGLHGGDRERFSGKEPSRYVLFANGMGCFFPENGTVLSTRNVNSNISGSDFKNTKVSRLTDGDWVLIREGHAGTNLDHTSDRLLEEMGEAELLEVAIDWKTALDAITLTKSLQEISSEIESFGSKVTARTIQLWCNGQVLGPATESVFISLIRYLDSQGKIRGLSLSLDDYISLRWRQLQEFRGLRHRAGNIIRNELIERLVHSIGDQELDLLGCGEFRISNDESSSLMLLRVEMVDSATSYVSPSRYGELDDLRGNKWLA